MSGSERSWDCFLLKPLLAWVMNVPGTSHSLFADTPGTAPAAGVALPALAAWCQLGDWSCCHPPALLSSCSCCVCSWLSPGRWEGSLFPQCSPAVPLSPCTAPSSRIALSLSPRAMGKYPTAPEQTRNASVHPYPNELFRIQMMAPGAGLQKPEQRRVLTLAQGAEGSWGADTHNVGSPYRYSGYV